MAVLGYRDPTPLTSLTPPAPPAATNIFTSHPTDVMSPGPQRGAGAAGLGYGGYTDYHSDLLQKIVNSQPAVMAANQALQAGTNTARSNLQSAIQNAVIGYGDPTLARQMGYASFVDPQTAALAAADTQAGTSALGQQNYANQLAQANVLRTLAGRGMADSGFLGEGLLQQGHADALARADLINKLRGTISGAGSTYLNAVTPLASDARTAYINQLADVAKNPQNYNMPSPTQQWVGGAPYRSYHSYLNFRPSTPGPAIGPYGPRINAMGDVSAGLGGNLYGNVGTAVAGARNFGTTAGAAASGALTNAGTAITNQLAAAPHVRPPGP